MDNLEFMYDEDDYRTYSSHQKIFYQKGYLNGIKSWWSNTKTAWKISYQLDREIFLIGILFSLGKIIFPTILLLATQPVLKILNNGLDQKVINTYMPIIFICIIIYAVFIFIKPYVLLLLEKRYKTFPLKKELFIKKILFFIPYEYAINSKKSFKVKKFRRFINDLFNVTETQISTITSILLMCLGFSIGIGLDPIFTVCMVISALFSLYHEQRKSIQNFHHENSDEETILDQRVDSISSELNFPLIDTKLSNQVHFFTTLFTKSKIESLDRDIVRKKNSILTERKNGLFDTIIKICILVYIIFKIKQGVVFDVLAAYYVTNSLVSYINSFGHKIIEQNELSQKLLFVSEILELSIFEEKYENIKKNPDTSNGIHIQFDNVSFRYPNEKNYVFKNMSFELSLNKLYGLKGDNGNGKTTLFKLISGILQPIEGTITINTIPISEIKRSWFSQYFSAYAPEMGIIRSLSLVEFLTTDAIKDKLTEIDILRMNKILEEIGLSEKINGENIKNLFLSPEHPNGTDFSSGQAQRLLIARMFMNMHYDAKYVLVDEMTANVSFEDQAKLAMILKKYCTGGILIAHNPQIIEVCDEILICKNQTITLEKQEQLVV